MLGVSARISAALAGSARVWVALGRIGRLGNGGGGGNDGSLKHLMFVSTRAAAAIMC